MSEEIKVTSIEVIRKGDYPALALVRDFFAAGGGECYLDRGYYENDVWVSTTTSEVTIQIKQNEDGYWYITENGRSAGRFKFPTSI